MQPTSWVQAVAATDLRQQYARFCAAQGQALRDHAVFEALHAARGGEDTSWPQWPAQWRDPESPCVRRFARLHAQEVDFHCFAQWLAAESLAQAHAAGREAGMRIGLVADLAVMDRYAVSLMNLGGTAVLLCAGLSRFVFPLLSLEGRKFWILGLTPVSRDTILRGKFAFAATGSLVIAEGLILLSDALLGLPPGVIALHAVAVAVIALGLSALNVGLGAVLPNFRETDPSKVVVGHSSVVAWPG